MTSSQHVYKSRLRKDKRGVDLISDALHRAVVVLTNQRCNRLREASQPLTYVTGSTASTALQFLESSPSRTGFLLDDVSVNPAGVGVPDGGSTVSLLGFALLGLAGLRRKLSR